MPFRRLGEPFRSLGSSLGAGLAGGGTAFYSKVVATTPITYWPLWETTGTTATDLMGLSDATYVNGVSLNNILGPDGTNNAPLFNGSNNYVNLYKAALAAAFSGAAGSVLIFSKIASAALTDGSEHHCFRLRVDVNNHVSVYKTTTNNSYSLTYSAGGTAKTVTVNTSSTNWLQLVITWDINAGVDGEVKAYLNGAQTGSTLTALGTWAGSLNANTTVMGSLNTTPLGPWSGHLAHMAIWTRAITSDEVAALNP